MKITMTDPFCEGTEGIQGDEGVRNMAEHIWSRKWVVENGFDFCLAKTDEGKDIIYIKDYGDNETLPDEVVEHIVSLHNDWLTKKAPG